MLSYPITILDKDLMKFQLTMQKIRLKKVEYLDNLGRDLYNLKFGSIKNDLVNLALNQTEKINKLEPVIDHTESLKNIFREVCKIYHPDINGLKSELFTSLNSAFQEGRYYDFFNILDNDYNNCNILYEKIVSIDKRIDIIKNLGFVHVGHCYLNNEEEFCRIMLNTKKEIKNRLSKMKGVV